MRPSTTSRMEVMPILVSIPQACAMIGRGTAALYELLGDGKIRAVKSNGRTLVDVESLRQYAKDLPAAKIAPPRRRKYQSIKSK